MVSLLCRPTQDMVIGCYYLTIVNENGKGAGRSFISRDEAMMAYRLGAAEPAGSHPRPH